MKIQITNLFFLSTVLLFISGCQELEQINLYNQSNLPPKNQENQLATKVIIVKHKNEELRNFFKPYINMSSSLNLTNMKLYFGENDYTRKHGKILTYQYRFDKCVLDLFYNENSHKLIYYDMRKRDYDGSLSIKKCLLEVNLRKIKLYRS